MTNSKTNAKTKENRLNQNGSLSKTDQRKLKPISFCGGVSKSMLKQSRLNFDKIEKCE